MVPGNVLITIQKSTMHQHSPWLTYLLNTSEGRYVQGFGNTLINVSTNGRDSIHHRIHSNCHCLGTTNSQGSGSWNV